MKQFTQFLGNMASKTIEFLTKEIEKLIEARDGVGKAWNVLKNENCDTAALSEIYFEFGY